ncbi:MAG: TIGR03013 family PEP-CTERM/XrtA system glycosyltransferase [Dissulfurispiraceae bacterium]|jgi:sugar transferase (PEP-CTERM system associated)|nr:TIGR03013 family PEP-CTERM/XrtA system glycosyltransferase [Dissulfurispiraceae bacterium]
MKTNLWFIAGDALLSLFAVFLSFNLLGSEMGRDLELIQLVPFTGIICLTSFMFELYNMEKYKPVMLHAYDTALSTLLSFLLLSIFFYIFPYLRIEHDLLWISLVAFGVFQAGFHSAYMSATKSSRLTRRVLVLGAGALALKVSEAISESDRTNKLIGFIKMSDKNTKVPEDMVLGTSRDIMHVVDREKIQRIVVAITERRGIFPVQEILKCKFSGINVMEAPDFYEEMTGKLLIENINPSWFIFCHSMRLNELRLRIKRAADIFISAIAGAVFLPIVPFVALAVRLDSKGDIFFRQKRVGQYGKLFTIYKFRTMRQDAEKSTGAVWAKEGDSRVTKAGRFLRKSRLDEIPQIYNILKGDMSIIGPRPERPEFVEGLSEVISFYTQRHSVKPGLTGWAQVRYPYGASVEDAIEKLRYDLYYIKNFSIIFDLGIILETIKVMLFGKGAR